MARKGEQVFHPFDKGENSVLKLRSMLGLGAHQDGPAGAGEKLRGKGAERGLRRGVGLS